MNCTLLNCQCFKEGETFIPTTNTKATCLMTRSLLKVMKLPRIEIWPVHIAQNFKIIATGWSFWLRRARRRSDNTWRLPKCRCTSYDGRIEKWSLRSCFKLQVRLKYPRPGPWSLKDNLKVFSLIAQSRLRSRRLYCHCFTMTFDLGEVNINRLQVLCSWRNVPVSAVWIYP